MTKPLPQTKLGATCRKLAKALEDTDTVAFKRLTLVAGKLDYTAYSLAARGERVKTLGAYRDAKRVHDKYAPQPYEA